MSTVDVPRVPDVDYPETDGKPMAENTLQYEWIVTIKEGIEALFADRPDVFIAGDLFWYPVKGAPKIVQAPDAMVVIGRPKGHRRSYKQWEEGGIGPQVVFEILSPSNTPSEMAEKLAFYERHGVSEYFEYDPDNPRIRGWLRADGRLRPIEDMQGWTSGHLGIRFEMSEGKLRLIRPDGKAFQTVQEIVKDRDEAERRIGEEHDRAEEERRGRLAERRKAEAERRKAEAERKRAEEAKLSEEEQRRRADILAERLRSLGIDPDSLG